MKLREKVKKQVEETKSQNPVDTKAEKLLKAVDKVIKRKEDLVQQYSSKRDLERYLEDTNPDFSPYRAEDTVSQEAHMRYEMERLNKEIGFLRQIKEELS